MCRRFSECRGTAVDVGNTSEDSGAPNKEQGLMTPESRRSASAVVAATNSCPGDGTLSASLSFRDAANRRGPRPSRERPRIPSTLRPMGVGLYVSRIRRRAAASKLPARARDTRSMLHGRVIGRAKAEAMESKPAPRTERRCSNSSLRRRNPSPTRTARQPRLPLRIVVARRESP